RARSAVRCSSTESRLQSARPVRSTLAPAAATSVSASPPLGVLPPRGGGFESTIGNSRFPSIIRVPVARSILTVLIKGQWHALYGLGSTRQPPRVPEQRTPPEDLRAELLRPRGTRFGRRQERRIQLSWYLTLPTPLAQDGFWSPPAGRRGRGPTETG